jgi:hypothetical protein
MQWLRRTIVAYCTLHWVHCALGDRDFFIIHPEPVPMHMALLDEIAIHHPQMHNSLVTLNKKFSLLLFFYVKKLFTKLCGRIFNVLCKMIIRGGDGEKEVDGSAVNQHTSSTNDETIVRMQVK